MANIDTGNGPLKTPQDEARPPKRGLMSNLKAMVKRVSNTWSRSPQIDSPPRAEYTSTSLPAGDRSHNIPKQQPETTEQQPAGGSIRLKDADKNPKGFVAYEQNQERLRKQLRQKMQPLDEALAARQEAAARERAKAAALETAKEAAALAKVKEANKGREIKETRPSGEIIYKRAHSPSGRAAIHLGDSAPPETRNPSIDAGVPPLPQALSVRSIKAEAHEVPMVDIPSSKKSEGPDLSRTPSVSTISSTASASSIFSTTSKSSVSTSASSIADAPPHEARKVDIPSSTAKKDAPRPSPTNLSRAEDPQTTQRRELYETTRTRTNGFGR